ncbi:MAG: pur operon repressor [Clostridiales bacterium]|nr:pur operon repressor [Clostridiales bacterium]
MDRVKRNERLGAIARILTDSPNRIYTLSHFCELFGAVKSSISDDIELLAESFRRFDLGEVTTVAGAAGGVRYRPIPSRRRAAASLAAIADKLSQPGRLLPGGFLYTSDITCDPDMAECMGEVLAAAYYDRRPDLVLTMETKGIPVAMMVARMLGVPLVIARRDSRAYEGSAVKINYISGSSGEKIETMALARRSVKSGQRALIIDDFAKGGGTLRGMCDLMAEFSAEVVGIGVVIMTAVPERKRVDGIGALMVLREVDPDGERALVVPADWALSDGGGNGWTGLR